MQTKPLKNQEGLNSMLIFSVASSLKLLWALKDTTMGKAGLEAEPRLMKPSCFSWLSFVHLGEIFGRSLPQFLLLEGLNVKNLHKHENDNSAVLYTAGHR